ncbi:MAG: DUF6340 family protein [Bacteroidales bacterium]
MYKRKGIIRLAFLLSLLCLVRSSLAQEIYLENTSKSNYQMDILRPAGITIDTSLRTILLFPGQPLADSQIEIRLNDRFDKSAKQMLPALFSQTCQRAAGILSEGPRFNCLIPENDSSFFPPEIKSWDDIQSFCRQAGSDVLAVLQIVGCTVGIRSQLTSENVYYSGDITSLKGIEGNPLVLAEIASEAEFTWQLYFPVEHKLETQKIRSKDQITNMRFNDKPELFAYMNEELPKILDRLSANAAQKFAQLVSPVWETTIRSYYDKGNSDMRLASRLLQSGKIDEAAAIWERLAESNNKGISKHARFNQLLICELDGNYAEGVQIAEKLSQEFSMPDAVSYAEILKERMREQELLDKQIPME